MRSGGRIASATAHAGLSVDQASERTVALSGAEAASVQARALDASQQHGHRDGRQGLQSRRMEDQKLRKLPARARECRHTEMSALTIEPPSVAVIELPGCIAASAYGA
jgi:hypothetical protein